MSHSVNAPLNAPVSGGSSAQTAQPARAAEFNSRFSGNKVGFFKLIRSEFIKVASLGSTYWLLGIAFVLTVGMSWLSAWGTNVFLDSINDMPASTTGGPAGPTDPAAQEQLMQSAKDLAMSVPTAGVFFSILIFGSWAVVAIAGEYGTGMIRSTLTAAPKRWPALLAKTVVAVVISSLVALAAFFASYALSQVVLKDSVHFALTDGNVMRSIWMNTLYVALIVLMGLGIGLLLRNAAGGICTIVGLLFVLPIIPLIASQVDWLQDAARFFPSNLGATMGEITDQVSQSRQENDPTVSSAEALTWNVAAIWLAVESGVIWLLGMLFAQKRDV